MNNKYDFADCADDVVFYFMLEKSREESGERQAKILSHIAGAMTDKKRAARVFRLAEECADIDQGINRFIERQRNAPLLCRDGKTASRELVDYFFAKIEDRPIGEKFTMAWEAVGFLVKDRFLDKDLKYSDRVQLFERQMDDLLFCIRHHTDGISNAQADFEGDQGDAERASQQ